MINTYHYTGLSPCRYACSCSNGHHYPCHVYNNYSRKYLPTHVPIHAQDNKTLDALQRAEKCQKKPDACSWTVRVSMLPYGFAFAEDVAIGLSESISISHLLRQLAPNHMKDACPLCRYAKSLYFKYLFSYTKALRMSHRSTLKR